MSGFSDFFPSASMVDTISAVGITLAVAIAIITDKLVWHTRLKKAEARAEKWEQVALAALGLGARVGVQAAEAAVEVVQNIPDPGHPKAAVEDVQAVQDPGHPTGGDQ